MLYVVEPGTTIKHHYENYVQTKLILLLFAFTSNGKHKNHFPASKIKNHRQEKYLIFIRFYVFVCVHLHAYIPVY